MYRPEGATTSLTDRVLALGVFEQRDERDRGKREVITRRRATRPGYVAGDTGTPGDEDRTPAFAVKVAAISASRTNSALRPEGSSP